MIRGSTIKKYDINKVSVLDIEMLIECGIRFTLAAGLDEEEYADVEEEIARWKNTRCGI